MKTKYNLIFGAVAALLLVFLAIYGPREFSLIVNPIQKYRLAIFSNLSIVRSLAGGFNKMKNLDKENLKLKEENYSLLSQLARQADLREENNFLREALDLPVLTEHGHRLVDAGVFNFQFTPNNQYLLINKTKKDGIEKDDIVVSATGILIGMIEETFESYSRVSIVTNPDFKATARVLSKNTSGIIRGSSSGKVSFDFISQNDDISEGDIVVTGGNDIFPPGLIVGKVLRINPNREVFKDIQIKAVLEEIDLSRALIIKK